jgi:ribosomal protein L25 (general stress protein Ctc)
MHTAATPPITVVLRKLRRENDVMAVSFEYKQTYKISIRLKKFLQGFKGDYAKMKNPVKFFL